MGIIREHINFERGLDPKNAMGIGSWEDLKEGDVLQAIQQIDTTYYGKIISKWSPSGEVIYQDYYIQIQKIEQKQNEFFIYYVMSDSLNKLLKKEYTNYGLHFIYGTLKQLKNIFKIVWSTELKEHINFERGLDPKNAMNIGIIEEMFKKTSDAYSFERYLPNEWRKIIKWLLKRYTSKQTEEILRSKIMRWAGDNSGKDYGHCSLQDFLEYNFYGARYFGENTIKRKESAINQFIREYKITNESIEFQRGLEPKEAMGTGVDYIYEKILEIIGIDLQRRYISGGNNGNIHYIVISPTRKIFQIGFYSNAFTNDDDEHKPIYKSKYANELVKLVGLDEYLEKGVRNYKAGWWINFKIKPEYKSIFKPETYNGNDLKDQYIFKNLPKR